MIQFSNIPQTLNITVKLIRRCVVDSVCCCKTHRIPIVGARDNHEQALGTPDVMDRYMHTNCCITHLNVHSCHCRQIYRDPQCQEL